MVIENENDLYISKIRAGAVIPTKKDEDAGYDMYACFDEDYFVIEPFATRAVPTGIAMAFSSKYYVQIEERSSTGKLGIKKSSGVMDSGYRGEYLIMTFNANSSPLVITKLDTADIPETFTVDGKEYSKANCIFYPYKKAICEFVFHEVPKLNSHEISYEELKSIESSRGVNGFGSSGK